MGGQTCHSRCVVKTTLHGQAYAGLLACVGVSACTGMQEYGGGIPDGGQTVCIRAGSPGYRAGVSSGYLVGSAIWEAGQAGERSALVTKRCWISEGRQPVALLCAPPRPSFIACPLHTRRKPCPTPQTFHITPTSGPLHLLLPLPGIFFPR